MTILLTKTRTFKKRISALLALSAGLCFSAHSALADASMPKAKGEDKYPTYPSIDYTKVKDPAAVRRGEYVAKIGDCIACHTAQGGGKPFAGNFFLDTPFGKIYTHNLTSDKETGIGNWSLAVFKKTMRDGVGPDGFAFPAFPYLYFNRMTDQDLSDIFAYLNALPKVHNKRNKNTLFWPISWRFTQLGWRAMFFYLQEKGPYVNDPSKSEQWNRGSYIVNGPGHCSMCHTQSYYLLSTKYAIGAPMNKYFLGGGMVDGGHAPDITSRLMKHHPINKIVDVFMHDELLGGGKVAQEAMLEVNHDSLSHLKRSDLEAIATYLKTVKSTARPAPKMGSDAGKTIYETYCTGCHTTGAGGAPKLGSKTAWDPLIKNGLKTLYQNAIHGIGGMPAKGTCSSCTDKQIQDAVDYIVNQAKSSTGSATSKDTTLKKLTLADGKKIYQNYCSVCHNPDTHYPGAPIIGDHSAWKPLVHKGMVQLFLSVTHGHGGMAPRGGCTSCNDADLVAATKYMVHESTTQGNYTLW